MDNYIRDINHDSDDYFQTKMKIRKDKVYLKKIRQINLGVVYFYIISIFWKNIPCNLMLPFNWKKQYRKNIKSRVYS